MERWRFIDVAKGFGIILVVLGHTAISVRPLIYLFHMPLFFILSGMLFKEDKTRHYGEFVVQLVQKLLIPYAILFLLSIPAAKLMSGMSLSVHELLCQFFMPKVALPHPNPTLWFFTALFWVQLMYGSIFCLRRRADWVVLLVSLLVTVAGCVCYGGEWLPLSFVRSWYFMLFFAVGHWFRLHFAAIGLSLRGSIGHLLGLSCCVLLYVLLVSPVMTNAILNISNPALKHGLGVLVALALSGAVMWTSATVARVPALEWMGRNTAIIFPMHIFPIQFFTYFLISIGLSPQSASDPFCIGGSVFALICMTPIVRFCSINFPLAFGIRTNINDIKEKQ